MYRQKYLPDHPRADITGLVAEHILVAEKLLGKPLPPKAIIHHKDFDKGNNTLSNLLFPITRLQHQQLPEYQARFIIAKGLYEEFLFFWSKQNVIDVKNKPIKVLEEKLIKAENTRERMKRKAALQNDDMRIISSSHS